MLWVPIIFAAGYLAIALEQSLRLNKAAVALLTGTVCWTVLVLTGDNPSLAVAGLSSHLGDLSQVLFFLMGAMTIVELIDAHDGFEIITTRIHTRSRIKLTWILALLSFFLSAVLDNLTTAIVGVSLVRKLATDSRDRWLFAGLIIIAANAGGAWSPIGDVTTTMLWIGGQVSASNTIVRLILPSLVCVLVPVLLMTRTLKGEVTKPERNLGERLSPGVGRQRNIVFFSGIAILLLVPVFKSVTHLPPFMGMLAGLGLMWLITEIIHSGKDEEDRKTYTVGYALQKIDTPSILFFLGILLAVSALETAGHLHLAAGWMDQHLPGSEAVVMSIGLLSAVVDNVPLVAASQGMYSLQQFPTDHFFWEFLAYATGTGGSLLIIGSAAGVAAMGIEKISFVWYLRKIGWLALAGYLAGAAVCMLQHRIWGH